MKMPHEYLLRLMQRGKLNRNWQLHPEQKLSVECADELRAATLEGRYNGIWAHVANEGKRSEIAACILKAMGLIPGALDNWHIWKKGSGLDAGLIEIKVKPNKTTDSQDDYILWAQDTGVKTAVVYSKQEYLDTLKQWGALV